MEKDNNKKINPPKFPSNFNFATKQKPQKPMTELSKQIKASDKIVGSEMVFEKTVREKDKKKIVIAILIALLAVLIATSIVLIMILPQATRLNDISINFDTTGSFKPIIADDDNQNPRQLVMPGDEVKCLFTIQSNVNAESDESVNLDVFVRFKLYFDIEDNYFSKISLDFIDGDMWFRGADGYYYLNKGIMNEKGVLSPGEKIEIANGFRISKDLGNEYAGKKVKVVFDCQALQANYQAIVELWPTAPDQWANNFRNLV